jgi:hypothetical protein
VISDAYDARFTLAEELGLRVVALRDLLRELNAQFRVEDWGYAQFGQLDDVWLQAIVSDHLLAAAEAVVTNLLDARL